MIETTEDQQESKPDFERYFDLLKRRHMHFLLPLFAGWLLVWGSTWVIPARYKSSTLILVEQPTMPKNYVVPNINDDLQDRLQSITQQILSRTRLLLIIDKLHLYESRSHASMTPDDKVALMRKDISIDLVRDAHNEEITAFRVSFSARDPHVAQKVTSELTALFINENLRVRQEQSEDTTKFIESQLTDARSALSSQEAKVKEFESTHQGSLPTQQASNLQILSGLQQQLQNEQDALNTAKQQRVYLQALLQQYRPVNGTPTAGVPVSPELVTVNENLEKLQAQLTDLRSRYTDRYPDVVKLKDQIARTEKIRDQMIADARRKASQAGSSTAKSADPNEMNQSAPVLQLQGQVHANQVEIANRERAIADLNGRIADYQARLNQEPANEQELADLTRGYDQSKANYDDLLKKMNESAMATSMEQMQQGQRFTMLDPPTLPLKPDFPDRQKFCGLGLVVGVIFGLGLVGITELLDDRIYSEKQLKALLPVEILSQVPDVPAPEDTRHRRRKVFLGWCTAILVFVVILAGSTYSLIRG